MKGFLEYQDGNTLFHQLNPLTKLFMAFVFCTVCFVSNRILFVLMMIGLNLLVAAWSGMIRLACCWLKGLLKLSILLFVIQVLFIRQGTVLFTLPVFSLGITREGVLFSLLLVLRLAAAALPLAIMLSVTKLNDLTNAMSSKLRIPYKYVFSIMTAIRFIPVFASEMSDIMEAQTARGVAFDTKNMIRKIRLIVPMAVPLLLASVRKIDVSTLSAELKGFNLRQTGSCYKRYPMAGRDAVVFIGSLCILTASVMLSV